MQRLMWLGGIRLQVTSERTVRFGKTSWAMIQLERAKAPASARMARLAMRLTDEPDLFDGPYMIVQLTS